MNKIVLHIPHSSIYIPEEYRKDFWMDEESLNKNLVALTDWKTEELFDVPEARNIVFPVSRLVCDPERYREDEKEEMAKKGMGLAYTHDAFGKQYRNVDSFLRERILTDFYDPHHAALYEACKGTIEKEKMCLLIDCHSFSGTPLPYENAGELDRPDFCIGVDSTHTPRELVERITAFLTDKGYRVKIDYPYAGTMIPGELYGDKRLKGFMIEINRDLYMQKNLLQKSERFEEIKKVIGEVIRLATHFHFIYND